MASAEARAREDADRRGWRFDRIAGELLLVKRLLDGAWDAADYLVVQPGEQVAMSYAEDVIRAKPVAAG